MARAKRRGPKTKQRKAVSLAKVPLGGDHGTGTRAATLGTVVVPLVDEKGRNPNHMGQRRRVSAIDSLNLTMRQQQAAKAIEEAYCRVQMLSSGGEIKERVQSSSKPDATIARQIDAQSQWVRVMKAVKPINRRIIEHVCCDNLPIGHLLGYKQARERLGQTLDAVADHMRY